MYFLCLWLTSFIFFEKQKRITDTTHFMIEHQPFYSLSQFNLSQNQNILLLICEGSEPDFFPSLQHYLPEVKMPYLSIPKKYHRAKENSNDSHAEIIEGIHRAFHLYFHTHNKKKVLQNKICIPSAISSNKHYIPFEETLLLRKGGSDYDSILHLLDLNAIHIEIPIGWIEAQIEAIPHFFKLRNHFWINLNQLLRIEQGPKKGHLMWLADEYSLSITGSEKRRIVNRFDTIGKRYNAMSNWRMRKTTIAL